MPARRATHHLWWRMNALAGFLVFGLPAIAACFAFATTVEKFGLLASLRAVAPACLAGAVPLLLWSHYVTHRPTSRRGIAGWLVIAAAITPMTVLLPVQWWSVPILLVIMSEIIRAAVHRLVPARSPKVALPVPGQEVALPVSGQEVAR